MASIRKRRLASGKTVWLVDFKDANGRRRARQFVTKREADRFLVNARAQVMQGIFVHHTVSPTVREMVEAWLGHCAERQAAGRRMEPATLADYSAKTRLHILDDKLGLGVIKLSELNRTLVLAFRDQLLTSGRSEATTRKVLSVLNLVLKHAIDRGLTTVNPVDGVRVIRSSRTKPNVKVPAKRDVRRLIGAATDTFRPLIVVSALCGLRASETRALRWVDLDFEKDEIRVRQRADRFNVIGEPKSAAGVRDVPMGPLVKNTLRQWQLICPQGELGLVFPNRFGVVRTHTTVLERHFKPLCKQLDIEMRWHDLRHFAISMWIEQGFPIKAVMTFAGHSSTQMTLDRYGHLFPSPDHQRGMAEIENRLFG